MSNQATPTQATPSASSAPYGIERLTLESGLRPSDLADLLSFMPDNVGGLTRRDVTTTSDSATVVYLTGEDGPQPRFGMIVVLLVEPTADADARVAEIEATRWGPIEDHTITGTGAGENFQPAYREFWRVFPPGLFAIPNQPVYFLICYRGGAEYAFMVIGQSAEIRQVLTESLVEALGTEAGP